MLSKFDGDFYIFATPKDDPDSNSHIKVMEGEFAGVIFVVNYIKLRKKHFNLFGKYVLRYDYTLIECPEGLIHPNVGFDHLVGEIIEDIWEKYYA